MKILIFTEGTILIHKTGEGKTKREISKQAEKNDPSIRDFGSYRPIKNAVEKIKNWKEQGAEICYMTSRTKKKEIEQIKNVLKRAGFPEGELFYRKENESSYNNIIKKARPNVFIDDDCESIGGREDEYNDKELKETRIKLIIIKEFEGIDKLPDRPEKLLTF